MKSVTISSNAACGVMRPGGQIGLVERPQDAIQPARRGEVVPLALPQRDQRQEEQLDRLVEGARRLGRHVAADGGHLRPVAPIRLILLGQRGARISHAVDVAGHAFQGEAAGVVENRALGVAVRRPFPRGDLVQEASYAQPEQLLGVGMQMARVAAGEGRHGRQDRARGIQRGPLVLRGIAEARPADDALARRDLHRHGGQPRRDQPRPPEQPILVRGVARPTRPRR